jgi:thiamine-phosphate pyrophosphorylase
MDPIIISSPADCKDEFSIVNQLFEAGLQIFHLRKPGYSMLDCKRFLRAINPVYHDRIALHQHHELADEFMIRRLHYPEALRNEQHIHLSTASVIRSTSIHHLDELRMLTSYDYNFFSPVFDSLSKPGYSAVTNANFKLKKEAVTTKVVALGGIDTNNVLRVKEMNFDGLALLGCIWNQPAEAVATFLEIKSLW